jgi:hypothetical protein
MSYFNHSFVKTFLPIRTNADLMNNVAASDGDHITAANAAGTAGRLATIDGDRFSDDFNAVVLPATLDNAVPYTTTRPRLMYFAQGSPYTSDTLGNSTTPHGGWSESWKSKTINPRYIQRIGYSRGVDGVAANVELVADGSKCFPCGGLGMVRLDLKGNPALRYMAHNMYKIFSSDNQCCASTASYQDPIAVMVQIGNQIKNDDWWKKFVTVNVYSTTDLTAGSPTWTEVTLTGDNAADYPASGYINPTDDDGAKLKITAGYTDTNFSTCSFDPRDYNGQYTAAGGLEPLIPGAQVLDDTGDVCVSCGTETKTAPTIFTGDGGTVLRDILLSERYRQQGMHIGNRDASRMRNIEQSDLLFNYVTIDDSVKYDTYYLTHSIPRFNNPTGVFDNDRYTYKIPAITGSTGATVMDTAWGQLATWGSTTNENLDGPYNSDGA